MNPQLPAHYDGCIDLALDTLSGFVLYATDDFFAEKENLLKPTAPVFIDDKYTDKGKWMDGWESQRRRSEGHDWAIIRLGLPGVIKGVIVDTTHFKGNAPSEIQLEGINEGDPFGDGYQVIIARTLVKPHTPNDFRLLPEISTHRFTHLKLRIYPDGGVARLRVYGHVVPDERVFLRPGAIDLIAVENGGECTQVSDRFFGPPSNLTLPGRGVNMGDGWETARRRTPGTDWCVLKLGRPGVIERIELDTHFFKGNAPQAVTIEAQTPQGWTSLVAKTPLEPHKRHVIYPDRPLTISHARVHIHPHGGVNRLRFFGEPVDSDAVKARLQTIDDAALSSFNGSKAWVAAMRGPFASARALIRAADEQWWKLGEQAWLEAFSAHPKLGDKKGSHGATAQEQAGIAASETLVERNHAYAEKFGFIFILCASGRTAPEVLDAIEARIGNTRAVELELAAAEQAKITRLRIEKYLTAL